MDKSATTLEIIDFIYKLTESHGSRFAYKRLRSYISQMDDSSIPDVLISASNALFFAAKNQELCDQLFFRQMASKAIVIPIDDLFANGFPDREFMVYGNSVKGRLGDNLNQLSNMLHAQKILDIVLCIKSDLSTYDSILFASKNYFQTDLPAIDQISVYPYLIKIAHQNAFDRNLLQNCSRELFNKIPVISEYNNLLQDESLVVHIRGGDALFDGQLLLPPASYYQKAIEDANPKKVLIVSEPDPVNEPSKVNPLPSKIEEFCFKKSIESRMISNHDVFYDAGLIFNASRVVASNSSFSIYLGLFSRSCEKIYIPDLNNTEKWINHQNIQYIKCFKGFDLDKWNSSFEYRLNWVCS